jgi:hypothetical protein
MQNVQLPVPVQYLVEADGQRTGVVLSWQDYQNLQARFTTDPDLLVGLSETELKALAEGVLSSPHQERLSQLLQLNQTDPLGADEEAELDRLLDYIDSMNVLKARAQYTLQQSSHTPLAE